jgi:hypothetical protein
MTSNDKNFDLENLIDDFDDIISNNELDIFKSIKTEKVGEKRDITKIEENTDVLQKNKIFIKNNSTTTPIFQQKVIMGTSQKFDFQQIQQLQNLQNSLTGNNPNLINFQKQQLQQINIINKNDLTKTQMNNTTSINMSMNNTPPINKSMNNINNSIKTNNINPTTIMMNNNNIKVTNQKELIEVSGKLGKHQWPKQYGEIRMKINNKINKNTETKSYVQENSPYIMLNQNKKTVCLISCEETQFLIPLLIRKVIFINILDEEEEGYIKMEILFKKSSFQVFKEFINEEEETEIKVPLNKFFKYFENQKNKMKTEEEEEEEEKKNNETNETKKETNEEETKEEDSLNDLDDDDLEDYINWNISEEERQNKIVSIKEEKEEKMDETLVKIYQKISKSVDDNNNEEIEIPKQFKLSLRPYQRTALHFMLNREKSGSEFKNERKLHPLFEELTFKDSTLFYYNKFNGLISLEFQNAPPDPMGGILADEMGTLIN